MATFRKHLPIYVTFSKACVYTWHMKSSNMALANHTSTKVNCPMFKLEQTPERETQPQMWYYSQSLKSDYVFALLHSAAILLCALRKLPWKFKTSTERIKQCPCNSIHCSHYVQYVSKWKMLTMLTKHKDL